MVPPEGRRWGRSKRRFPANLENLDYMEIDNRSIAMREFSTGDLNKQVGDVTDAASREPVVLTKHRKPRS